MKDRDVSVANSTTKEKLDAVLDNARATYPLRMDAEIDFGLTDLNYMALCLRDITEAFYQFGDVDTAISETLNAFKEITRHMTPKELETFHSLVNMARDYVIVFYLTPSRKEQKHTADSCVYVLQMQNHSVKIGVASDFEKRLATITHASGMAVTNWCHTDYINRKKAVKIEHWCHAHFQLQRAEGEFFNIKFDDACAELEKHAAITEQFLLA